MKKILLFLFCICTLQIYANSAFNAYVDELKTEAKKENPNFNGFDFKRGEQIFSFEGVGKNNEKISCQSCHSADLTKSATNIHTGKVLAPLSPKVNPARLSDVDEVKKWLKRNFKDVYGREGTALEKGDVLEYIKNF